MRTTHLMFMSVCGTQWSTLFLTVLCLLFPAWFAPTSHGQQVFFTYQGELKQNGKLANGQYLMAFSLWDSDVGGNQIGATYIDKQVHVDNGRFSALIGFQPEDLNAISQWLQIEVNGSALFPRTFMSSTPFSAQTRGIHVDDHDNVGIGTAAPQRQLELESETESAIRVSTMNQNPGATSRLELKTADSPGIFTPLGRIDFLDESDTLKAFIQATKASTETFIDINVSPGNTSQLSIDQTGVEVENLTVEATANFLGDLSAPNGATFLDRVGVGTTSPDAMLHASSNNPELPAIFGHNSSTTSGIFDYGVQGLSDSPTGSGVFGRSLADKGISYGVQGIGDSDDGAGVIGFSGGGIGVIGTSIDFRGVYGSSITGVGVRGESNIAGVFGWATGSEGFNTGIRGSTNSSEGFGVYSFGDLGGTGAKFFVHPHPTDASKEIRFVCLEGNESGTYFRGSAELKEGRAVISIPADFRMVTENEGLTVQLTPMGPNADLWIESKSLDKIVVKGKRDIPFDYFVNGVRHGYKNLQTIRENSSYVPRYKQQPFGSELRRDQRQRLVENGILNADFTPNEAMAERMGWRLKQRATNNKHLPSSSD